MGQLRDTRYSCLMPCQSYNNLSDACECEVLQMLLPHLITFRVETSSFG